VSGEKEFFRKRFFGGFNREDVIKYIAGLAEERNEALAAKERAEKKARALAEEVKKLRGETAGTRSEPVVKAKSEPEEKINSEPVAKTPTARIKVKKRNN